MKSLFLSQSTQLKEFKNYKIASYEINFHNGNDTFQATLDFDVVLTELQKKNRWQYELSKKTWNGFIR